MRLRETISWLKAKIQSDLFPHLEENFKDFIQRKLQRIFPLTTPYPPLLMGNKNDSRCESSLRVASTGQAFD